MDKDVDQALDRLVIAVLRRLEAERVLPTKDYAITLDAYFAEILTRAAELVTIVDDRRIFNGGS